MGQYDCIVIGGGWGGIAFALLYAMQGKKTAIFESHDRLGGYGHCFERAGYQYCADMHYFFNTKPGGTVDKFLKKVNLHDQILFNDLNAAGFDVIRNNGLVFSVPSNLEHYRLKLIQQFPNDKAAINKLFKIREHIELVSGLYLDDKKSLFSLLFKDPVSLFNFANYFLRSSKSVLDRLNIHGPLRTILLSRLGNFGLLSADVPLMMLLLEMTYYTNCASFPEKGMGHFIGALHKKLIEHNVSIFLETEVKKISYDGKKITAIYDQHDQKHVARLYVSDIDPKLTFKLCDFPVPKKYHYDYTYSCFSCFLGLYDIDLSGYSFGNFNTWYFPSDHIDEDCLAALTRLDYEKSYMFISTPSMHVATGILSQPGSHTMQIVLPADYQTIKNLHQKSQDEHEQLKAKVLDHVLNILSQKFIPPIRDHLEVAEIWSPIDLKNRIKTPCAAMYGMRPDWRKILWPVGHGSPFKNLYFVGATASHAGLAPVLNGAMKLFDRLK